MDKLLAVGFGGFFGAILRYGYGIWIPRIPFLADCPMPLPTLLANLSGCLLIGLLKGIADCLYLISPSTSLFLFTGVLGAFTTFSTFAFESWTFLEDGKIFELLLYVSLSVFLGIVLVWAGYNLSCRLFQDP